MFCWNILLLRSVSSTMTQTIRILLFTGAQNIQLWTFSIKKIINESRIVCWDIPNNVQFRSEKKYSNNSNYFFKLFIILHLLSISHFNWNYFIVIMYCIVPFLHFTLLFISFLFVYFFLLKLFLFVKSSSLWNWCKIYFNYYSLVPQQYRKCSFFQRNLYRAWYCIMERI